jgi:DNA-binding transcriptional LysR family regulator
MITGSRTRPTTHATRSSEPRRHILDSNRHLSIPSNRALQSKHLPPIVTQFLIANPRLEIPVTPTKQRTDPSSNREDIAFFYLVSRKRDFSLFRNELEPRSPSLSHSPAGSSLRIPAVRPHSNLAARHWTLSLATRWRATPHFARM